MFGTMLTSDVRVSRWFSGPAYSACQRKHIGIIRLPSLDFSPQSFLLQHREKYDYITVIVNFEKCLTDSGCHMLADLLKLYSYLIQHYENITDVNVLSYLQMVSLY